MVYNELIIHWSLFIFLLRLSVAIFLLELVFRPSLTARAALRDARRRQVARERARVRKILSSGALDEEEQYHKIVLLFREK